MKKFLCTLALVLMGACATARPVECEKPSPEMAIVYIDEVSRLSDSLMEMTFIIGMLDDKEAIDVLTLAVFYIEVGKTRVHYCDYAAADMAFAEAEKWLKDATEMIDKVMQEVEKQSPPVSGQKM